MFICFRGYCPLSLRENDIEGKWGKISEVSKRMLSATIFPENESVISNSEKKKKLVFIVFVGGVTYTEIEGIRFLNMKFNEENKNSKWKKVKFVTLTTGILSAKKVLEIWEKIFILLLI